MESSGQIYVTQITFVIYGMNKSYITYAINMNAHLILFLEPSLWPFRTSFLNHGYEEGKI